jgi:DNA-binding transcriptional regulator YdaS (Cro superfamily)
MNDSQIIDLLGGPTAIAKRLNISPPAVCVWRKNGIPADKMVYLAAMIEEQSKGLISRKTMFPAMYAWIWPEISLKNMK